MFFSFPYSGGRPPQREHRLQFLHEEKLHKIVKKENFQEAAFFRSLSGASNLQWS